MGIEIPKPFSVGERLALVREKDNKYDEWCIRVNTSAGGRLGFVLADINEIPARLMDGGKALYSEVNKVEKVGGWWKMGMGVWLDD